MTFTKNDAGKLRFDLITPEFLEGLANNLTIGAAIYGDRNWEQGAEWHRYIRSTMGHWNKWIAGEEYDVDGFHHLDACAFGIMVLRTFFARGIGNDDRPTSIKRRAHERILLDSVAMASRPEGLSATAISNFVVNAKRDEQEARDAAHTHHTFDREGFYTDEGPIGVGTTTADWQKYLRDNGLTPQGKK